MTSATTNDPFQPEMSDLRRDQMWTQDLLSYLHWFKYLLVSPSYELARRYRANTLTAADRAKLPSDIKKVLKVFDDFGDVQRQLFLPWWRQRGMALCAVKGNEPNVSSFAGLRHRDVSLPDTSESLTNYIINKWIGEGGQNTILVAIPAGLPKAKVTRQIHSILDQLPDDFKKIEKLNPTYKLSGQRINVNMLSKYLRVLIGRAQHPNEPLWRIGSALDVSAKHSPKLHYNAVLARKEDSDKKRVLSILTSRAFKRSLLISENAARGVFPSYAACPNAVKPNLGELHEMRESRKLWEEAQRDKVSE